MLSQPLHFTDKLTKYRIKVISFQVLSIAEQHQMNIRKARIKHIGQIFMDKIKHSHIAHAGLSTKWVDCPHPIIEHLDSDGKL